MGCDNYCSRCREPDENVTHAIFECPPALQAWELSSTPSSSQIFSLSRMYANMDYQSSHEGYGRARGQGGRNTSRGRGLGRYNNQRDWKQGRDTSRVVCFRCDKTGHYAYLCPDRLLKIQEALENENESTEEAE